MQHASLTQTQLGIYLECNAHKDKAIYLIAYLVYLNQETELQALAAAIKEAALAHSFSKIRITKDEEGMPYQYLCDSDEIDLSIEKMSDEDFEAQKSKWPELMQIENSPLAHFQLIETPSGKYLYYVFHHLIADGFSELLFDSEIGQILQAKKIRGEAVSIIDIAQQEAEIRKSEALIEAKEWYTNTFGAIEAKTMPLPDIDSHSAEALEPKVEHYSIILDLSHQELFEASRRMGVKISTLCDGAFGYMAGTFIASQEAFFSTIYNSRKSEDENTCITMMAKTLPVYCSWDRNTSVSEYLSTLQRQRDLAKKHDIYSYAELCADLKISQNLFFCYRGSINEQYISLNGNAEKIEDFSYLSSGEGITFVLDHWPEGMRLTVEYRRDQYSPDLIESMVKAYNYALSQILKAELLSEIALVDKEKQIESDMHWHKEIKFDANKTVVDLFREQARLNTEQTAIVAGAERLSYAQLAKLSDNLASFLHSQGIGKGSVVPIIIPRNEYMAVASLGVLKAGAAYQPLDPSYPTERLQFMVEDSEAAYLIADENLASKVSGLEDKTLLTKDIAALPEASEEVLKYSPKPEDRFILLYTSGSTGKPKGCILQHSNLADLVNVAQTYFHYDGSSKIAAYASFGFDANLNDLYPALCHGSTVYVISEDIRFDMVALNDYFAEQGITHCLMTTQVARTFATSVEVSPSLKYLTCGGERFVPISKPETYTMYNLYGPTEATVYVTAQALDTEYDRIPIGEAIPNVRLYVVDKNGHLLPPLATGEMILAGRQVALGYLNRPEKTAEVFIANPFSKEKDYSRAYRTGDLVRRLADGRIDFIGRNDGQIKIRGFRVELSEIEAVIREFPGLSDVTAAAFDDPAGGKYIAAYIVANQKIELAELNAFIAERKPAYMVPAVTMQIDKIPLTQNQKVDKRALPKPVFQSEDKASSGPRRLNNLEKALQELLASVLKIKDADISTPLELLGLSSISAIKLAMAIYKSFDIDLKTSDLLGLNSIETVENKLLDAWMNKGTAQNQSEDQTQSQGQNQGQSLSQIQGQSQSQAQPQSQSPTQAQSQNQTQAHNQSQNQIQAKIQSQSQSQTNPSDAPCALPLTISQQGVYADCMRNPASTHYNIPFYYHFPLSLDADKLETCVKVLIEHHPYLNTAFTLAGNDVAQTINKDIKPNIERLKLSEAEFETYKSQFVRPFDLLQAPLYRIAIVSTEEANYLVIDIHHIIFDGSSLSVFMGELLSLLNGASLPKEVKSYNDYVLKETALDKTASKLYFAELLKDCEAASELSANIPQNNDNQGDGVEIFDYLDFDNIEKFCKNQGITPASLCLAATGYVVSRFTGGNSAYLNTVSTGRNDVHFAETIGMFVKTLPVVVNISDGTCADFAKKTNEMLHATVANEIYPYSEICKDYNYAPHIMYEYQLGLEEELAINDEVISRQSLSNDTLKFKIAVRVELRNGRPAIIVYYKNGLYTQALMRRFARAITLVAQRIALHPLSNAHNLSMLDTAEENQLKDFSVSSFGLETPIKLFHSIFEAQVDKNPDKEILIASDGNYSYSQIDQRANRVANALIARGLKKGDAVLVVLHRSSLFFSAVFGVSKAGGVFIPTNPDYPEERIRTIVEDSAARFILDEKLVQELETFPDATRPCANVLPEDKVYMIYTSGSTGKPKGVELRHESICNYLTDHEANPQIHKCVQLGSCYGSVTTVAFDMSFKEWALALCNGIKLVFASDEETLDPIALARRLNDNQVDIFNATPSRLLQYMEVDSFAQAMSRCKVILSGGERYPDKLLSLLKEKTNALIINTYGPTEITVSSNAAILSQSDTISIGHPLLNYKEYIVDSDNNLLPIGVVGELIICGIGVASGYHNLPEQTQKAFIDFKGERAYRSGDYARWLEDGSVEVLGRKDNQVKLRGLRIELGEIEKALTNVEGVKSGIILIRKLGAQEAICAYYTLQEGISLSSDEIKAQMAMHLTDYMVPSAFVCLESMPLTPNGKINTKALPEPQQIERQKGREVRSEGEKIFADIFKKVLSLDCVYADDNFFELGGSSLTVTRVVIAAGKAGIDLTYAEVFSNPSPEKLAALKTSRRSNILYPEFEDLSAFDYSEINKLLKDNNLASFIEGEKQSFSKVLLTGATGFLGIHILYELLHNYTDCEVYCLLRSKEDIDASTRLSELFFYYFEEVVSDLFSDRINVIEGDITQKDSFELCKALGIDLVINCAANVKHFSEGTDIEDVNYYGVLNVIDYCEAVGARLVHVSTMSVGGVFVDSDNRESHLRENMLYYGQQQISKYTQSKFMAERAILDAVAQNKLSAKIMRVGNLAPRIKDGEYQINFNTNSFMARMKSSYFVGAHSFDSETNTFELSPIDSVAQAILLLASTPKANIIFHPYNDHLLLMADLYDIMAKLNLPSLAMEESEYQKVLDIAEQDPRKARVLTALLAYRQNKNVKIYNVGKSSALTIAVLSRLGFHWPMTDILYTQRFICALDGLGFFEE